MRRQMVIGALLAIVVVVAGYWFLIRDGEVEPRVQVPKLVATVGEGEDAVGIAGNGAAVRWLPLPQDPPLPVLAIDEVPKGGRVRGPALEQVRILAAAPGDLQPYVGSTSYGESGVVVTLTTGIDLGFGDATQARRKWRAAAAVLADPEVTSVDYVDLHAPSRPSYEGSEHELPPAP